MKKILTIAFALLVATAAQAQQAAVNNDGTGNADSFGKKTAGKIILPGKGHIDVEQLNRHIDTGMDISQLSISELRVLRNAFAARQGYPFMSSELRRLFEATSWYDEKFVDRYMYVEENWDKYTGPEQNEETPYRNGYLQRDQNLKPLKYDKKEIDFIRRLKAREDYLKQQNFKAANGRRVNTGNIINIYQMDDCPDSLTDRLARNGFAIVPARNRQMFHVYERNDYHVFPSFITTDIYMQLFHLYFDCMMREVEQQGLFGATEELCRKMKAAMDERAAAGTGDVKDAAEYCSAYFAIAENLLAGDTGKAATAENAGSTGNYSRNATGRYAPLMNVEMAKIMAAEDKTSDFIDGYDEVRFNYSLFRPRGHYTRNDTLSRYFRAMMWLQSVPFGTDSDRQLKRAMMMADVLCGSDDIMQLYLRIDRPVTFLMGTPDNVTVVQLAEEMKKTGLTIEKLFKKKSAMAKVRRSVEEIGERQTRIRPKFEITSRHKINLMPQRYMPDAEVLLEMVDYKNFPTLRDTPRGLDVMAAMRWSAAERILIDEMGEKDRWDGFTPTLERMKRRMDSIEWNKTVATRWMESLTTLGKTGPDMPYFMLTPEWQKKCLNTALASWSELKHDAILYAKQPMGAECGGAGPPNPVTKGYVEPDTAFWTKAIQLLDATAKVIGDNGLGSERIRHITQLVREEAEFLLRISRKELQRQRVTDEEYDQIRYLGSRFEYLSLDMLRDPDQYLDSWDNVQGPDKNIAVIADVYTANAINNPSDKRSILYEGVGDADEIYVVVEIDGYLYLTRGAVFSYRELKRPLGTPRLTDEEWQKMLKASPDMGRQKWMKDIIVPLKQLPEDDERMFYSSGC